MLEAQRHKLICELLEIHGTISLKTLVDEVGASEATLRRDLIKLGEGGALRQVRGGAMRANDAEFGVRPRRHPGGSAFLASLEREVEAKAAIAEKAADMCAINDAIIINGGSTTYHMGAHLRLKSLSVLTNSMALAADLIENSMNRVVLPAGEVHRKLSFILNPLEDQVTDSFRASKYFLSAYAVSEKCIMEADPLVARAEQRLAELSDEVILLADSTKLCRNGGFAAFKLGEIDKVITDDRIGDAERRMFEAHDVEVIVVRRSAQSSTERRA